MMPTGGPLLALLHLCDSLFPTGGFAHSDGLEAAAADGTVASAGDLDLWMNVVLDESLGRGEGPAVVLAWRAFTEHRRDDLDALDAEIHALRPSSTARKASRAMGTRLLKAWQEIHPDDQLASLLQATGGTKVPHYRLPAVGGPDVARPAWARVTLPVAFGVVCASTGIDSRTAVEAFIYTRLAATVSCAMRLMPIGQREAHALLAGMLARVPGTIDAIERRLARGERPGAFAPAFDLATMAQQHVRSRLFLS